VIDFQKLIQNSQRGQEIQKKLEAIGKQKQEKIDQMQQEVEKLEKELLTPALNQQTKEQKAIQLDEKRTNLKRFVEDAQNEFEKQYRGEMLGLQKEIMPMVQELGKSLGYSLIYDLSSSGISYVDKSIDITDKMIEEYNKKK
jgi:Skp family chaperone for outer membrane proteins